MAVAVESGKNRQTPSGRWNTTSTRNYCWRNSSQTSRKSWCQAGRLPDSFFYYFVTVCSLIKLTFAVCSSPLPPPLERWRCGSRTGGWSGREWREGSRLRPTTWKTTTLTRPPRPALNERRRSDAERRGLDWTPANAAQCNPSTISLESCRNQTLFFFFKSPWKKSLSISRSLLL